MNIVDYAELYATRAHAGQVRKNTGEPYIVHPKRVVAILNQLNRTNSFQSGTYWFSNEELAAVTLFESQYFPEDTFQPSWMDAVQIRALEDTMVQGIRRLAVGERVFSGSWYIPEPQNVWGWLFGGSWGAFDKYPEDRREGLEDVRFVYWFMH